MKTSTVFWFGLLQLPVAEALVTPNLSPVRATTTARHVYGTGWDNDGFLDSLGKDSDEQEAANDAYFDMARFGRPSEDPEDPPFNQPRRQQQQGSQSFPSARQFQREAQDGFSKEYAQQFAKQPQQKPQPNPQEGQASPSPMGQNDFMQQLQQLSQQQQQIQDQIQQLQQQQQYGQPPLGHPTGGSPPPPQQGQQNPAPNAAQDAFARQLAFQQQRQQPYTSQPPTQTRLPEPVPTQPDFSATQSSSLDDPSEQKDELPGESIEGAELTEEMKAKAKASHTPDEEASQGGQLFRSMMARAKQRAAQQQRIAPVQPPPPSQSAQEVQIPANAMDLSVEEQARLFREIMAQRQQEQQLGTSTAPNQGLSSYPPEAQQQQASASYARQQLPSYPYGEDSPKPQYLPDGIGYDGRKIGRNKDADMISNNADVYLAKLKRDSSTRRMARDAGDNEKANAVFHDPKIQEITAPVNPYLEEERARQRDMLETVPDEMLLFQEYGDTPGSNAKERSHSGVSFREKLAQQKAKKQQEQQQQSIGGDDKLPQ